MDFKLTCGLIMVLSSAVTHSTIPGVVPVGGGIFETGNAEMSRDVLYPCQGDAHTWDSVIGAIVQGGGSLIKRSPEGEKAMQAARDKAPGPAKSGEYIKEMLGWQSELPAESEAGNFWEEKVYRDRRRVALIKNEFPYGLPPLVDHWMLWIRIQTFTEAAFEPLSHETLPNPDFKRSIRRKALLRYLNYYDFYGYSGISEDVINRFRLSGFYHPTEDTVWKDPESSEVVTRLEGIEAMHWLGRHVLNVIHVIFSPERYEILFNRSTERWKSVVYPDHFHVIVKPKSAS
ncbi:hypothetical protein PGT21_030750 [Puccinia graminis f. sp. tritici]|uniref:Uncharacterized protein n=1 Tax=Puccinia graminis f. sp. tritici TaxID=56615 RepID=A0A5B0PHU8_PUCGR|nr:hypothetical protein PGT21_030750 [Puccinia graminis f. sp. tritici]KAA1120666.1 hypothetical protein PGTUg99_019992 [Puccinia graminis f. sp. tritici]